MLGQERQLHGNGTVFPVGQPDRVYAGEAGDAKLGIAGVPVGAADRPVQAVEGDEGEGIDPMCRAMASTS